MIPRPPHRFVCTERPDTRLVITLLSLTEVRCSGPRVKPSTVDSSVKTQRCSFEDSRNSSIRCLLGGLAVWRGGSLAHCGEHICDIVDRPVNASDGFGY